MEKCSPKEETKFLKVVAVEVVATKCEKGIAFVNLEVFTENLNEDTNTIVRIPSDIAEGIPSPIRTNMKLVFENPKAPIFKGLVYKSWCEFEEEVEKSCGKIQIREIVRQKDGNYVTVGDFKVDRQCDELTTKMFYNDSGRFVKCCKNKVSKCGKNPCEPCDGRHEHNGIPHAIALLGLGKNY